MARERLFAHAGSLASVLRATRLKSTIESWIGFWKDRLAQTHPDTGMFQAGGFHFRMRDGDGYAQKW
jgi:hypothetical protein